MVVVVELLGCTCFKVDFQGAFSICLSTIDHYEHMLGYKGCTCTKCALAGSAPDLC